MNIEEELKAKGLTAPRITSNDIEANIIDISYHVFENSCLTVCCITLKNGFNTIGHSACVSPDNFDKHIGETVALGKAVDEIWQLLGYALKESLYNEKEHAAKFPGMS